MKYILHKYLKLSSAFLAVCLFGYVSQAQAGGLFYNIQDQSDEQFANETGVLNDQMGAAGSFFDAAEDTKTSTTVLQEVHGIVTDAESGEALPGVNVIVSGSEEMTGSMIGTTTDIDGFFELDVPDELNTLVFTYVGYQSLEININGRSELNVQLNPDVQMLEDLVVIGYGTVQKSDLTGSVASISAEEIQSVPSTTVSQALQGRASGVHVIQNTGRPGEDIQIRIRGINSIRGDNSPLWIIDGFPGDPNMLNSSDIESIDVLKDASATAIYGSRGANGVIIVSTNRGHEGAYTVNYKTRYSIQSLRERLDLMNAEEYMRLVNIQQLNDEGEIFFTEEEINNAEGTDWQDFMFREAPLQEHSLSVSGGNSNTQFSIGGSYFDQEGIVLNDNGYRRISLNAKIDHDFSSKFNISSNIILSRVNEDTKYATNGLWNVFGIIPQIPPTASPYNEDGSYRQIRSTVSQDLLDTQPHMLAHEVNNRLYSNKIMANLAFNYEPIDGLSLRVSGNFNNSESRSDNYTSIGYVGSTGDASINIGQNFHVNNDNIVTYNRTINEDHEITATGVFSYEHNESTPLGISGSGFISDVYETYNISSARVINTPNSSFSDWTLMSYAGRLNYVYQDKYLATINYRADGSSRYSSGQKWGYFPSGALAWVISNESFMGDLDFLSNLKLRVGYGETGSTSISPYSTLSMMSTGQTVFDKDNYTYFGLSSNYPGALRWETTTQTNIGIDVGLFDNRVNFVADYYIKNTRDLLNSVQLPRSTGYSNTIRNIGEIQNRGLELQVDVNNILNKRDLVWNINANISFNRNEVKKLYDGQDITGSNFNLIFLGDYFNLVSEGEPISVFHGFHEDGYDENGLIKYIDTNGDGEVNADDKTIIGDPNPDFIFGFNSSLSYKNFDLNLFIQGSYGNDIASMTMAYQHNYGAGRLKDVLYDHWTPETPNATYPKITNQPISFQFSDRFIYDGSYIRLKNIKLTYNIPFDKIGVQFVRSGRIFVSGQNLFTISNYPYYDPEINSFGGSSSLNQGIDFFSYPPIKSFSFGVGLDF